MLHLDPWLNDLVYNCSLDNQHHFVYEMLLQCDIKDQVASRIQTDKRLPAP